MMHFSSTLLYDEAQLVGDGDFDAMAYLTIEKGSSGDGDAILFFEAYRLGCQLHLVDFVLFGLAVFVFYGVGLPEARVFWMADGIGFIAGGMKLYYVGDAV